MELRSDQALQNEIVGLAECNPKDTFERCCATGKTDPLTTVRTGPL
jgi:hypothetical protein